MDAQSVIRNAGELGWYFVDDDPYDSHWVGPNGELAYSFEDMQQQVTNQLKVKTNDTQN